MTSKHCALSLKPQKIVVFTAMSKKLFYMRYFVVKYALDNGVVPINPFTSFDYFLLDSVDRDSVRQANNTLIDRSDELWVFGDISDGVEAEITLSQKAGKPIRYFVIENDKDIIEIDKSQARYE